MKVQACPRCAATIGPAGPDAGFGRLCPRCVLAGALADGATVPQEPILGQSFPDAVTEATGERVGKYVKVARLGAGGMGEVWKAWDTELRRVVALKLIRGHNNETEIARFRREAQMAAKLSHPNIASVYEATDSFIAMQFVEGVTLQKLPRNNPRILAEVMRQAAGAVQYAHEHGVIHRDLKPANITVSGLDKAPATRALPGLPSAPQMQVHVMDFGLAKSTNIDSSISVKGAILGTPSYMSPEQAKGSDQVGPRSDVYSLGATFYEILSGQPPFKANELATLLGMVVNDEPRPPRKIDPKVDADLETIAMKCLEKDGSRRYANAQELADDLSRWLSGEPIVAHPPSFVYRLGKFVRRRRAILGVAVAGLAAVALAVSLLIPRWLAERQKAEIAARRERELKLYLPIEGKLNELREKFYRPRFRLTQEEFDRYAAIETQIVTQMKQSGSSAQGWYLIGRCREVTADFDGARAAYENATSIDAGHAGALIALGKLKIEQGVNVASWRRSRRDRDEAARRLYQEGLILVNRGLAESGGAASMERDLAEAYAFVARRERRTPFSAEAMMKRWQSESFVEEFLLIEAISSDSEGCERATTEVIARMPSSYRAHFWRAAGLSGQRRRQDAIRSYELVVEIHPRLAEAWYHLGHARYQADDPRRAVSDLTRAVQLAPDLAEAWAARGLARIDLKEFEGADVDFSRAIALAPEYLDAYQFRGLARKGYRDFAGAIADYTKALEIAPEEYDVLYERGSAYEQWGMDHLAQAEADVAKAFNQAPPHWSKRKEAEETLRRIREKRK